MIEFALEAVMEELQAVHSWTVQQCDITYQGEPKPTSGQFFVGIDDAGVNSAGRPNDYWLKEQAVIEVSIWREIGALPRDRTKQAIISDSIYRAGRTNLRAMERAVIATLHNQYSVLTRFNGKIEAGDNTATTPLYYAGRSGHQMWNRQGGQEPMPYLGRRLRFRGLDLTQRTAFIV